MTISLHRKDGGAAVAPRFGLARVTWRQQRATLLALGGLAAALAAVMLAAGLRGHTLYPAYIRDHCGPTVGPGLIERTASPSCSRLGGQFPWLGYPFDARETVLVLGGNFLNSYPNEVTLAMLALFLLTGMFLGAPLLAREFGQGTFRFAWTQGTSPVRWCVTKLVLLGGVVMVAGAGLGALGAWSLQPFNLVAESGSRWQGGQFETTVLTAAAWAGFAFALGAFSGTLFRRTVPAMAATLAAMGALLVATFSKFNALVLSVHPLTAADNAQAAQAGLATAAKPVRLLGLAVNTSVNRLNPGPPGSLLLRGWYTGPDGHRLSGAPAAALIRAFGKLNAPQWSAWLSAHHDTFVVSYQPGGRYWILQGVAGGALFLLTLVLGAATVGLVVRSRGARIRGRRPGPG
jgi:hypothetical protein